MRLGSPGTHTKSLKKGLSWVQRIEQDYSENGELGLRRGGEGAIFPSQMEWDKQVLSMLEFREWADGEWEHGNNNKSEICLGRGATQTRTKMKERKWQ